MRRLSMGGRKAQPEKDATSPSTKERVAKAADEQADALAAARAAMAAKMETLAARDAISVKSGTSASSLARTTQASAPHSSRSGATNEAAGTSASERVIVYLVGATDLPRLRSLNRPNVSPSLSIQAVDMFGTPIGRCERWARRPGTRRPMWNSAHDLRLPPMSDAELGRLSLQIEVWDSDPMFQPQLLASTQVPLSALGSSAVSSLPLVASERANAVTADGVVSLISSHAYSSASTYVSWPDASDALRTSPAFASVSMSGKNRWVDSTRTPIVRAASPEPAGHASPLRAAQRPREHLPLFAGSPASRRRGHRPGRHAPRRLRRCRCRRTGGRRRRRGVSVRGGGGSRHARRAHRSLCSRSSRHRRRRTLV